MIGVVLPLAFWGAVAAAGKTWAYLARFFAGFCLIANGAYIAVGSFDRVGDAGEMLRLGSPIGALWAFGLLTAPAGLWLWHKQGRHFGWGQARGQVDRRAVWACFTLAVALTIGFCWLGE